MAYRFYWRSANAESGPIIIKDQEIIHQLTNVLRLKKNDIFTVFNQFAEFELVIKEINNRAITADIIEKKDINREPARQIYLYQSLLKKDNFEWILQKGTELGVQAFIPLVTDNSIVREITEQKEKRFQKIIKEATEQCGGRRPPEFKKSMSFTESISYAASQNGQKIIAWEGEKNMLLAQLLKNKLLEYHLFIGPEGGFTAEEIKFAKKNKFDIVSLGPRILRAETAAIAAASIILLSS